MNDESRLGCVTVMNGFGIGWVNSFTYKMKTYRTGHGEWRSGKTKRRGGSCPDVDCRIMGFGG